MTDQDQDLERSSRRLIILIIEPGLDPAIDYEGVFAFWEVKAALEKAGEMIDEDEFDEYMREQEGKDEEE